MTQRELWLRVYADVFAREWENPNDPSNWNSSVPGIAASAANAAVDGAVERGLFDPPPEADCDLDLSAPDA